MPLPGTMYEDSKAFHVICQELENASKVLIDSSDFHKKAMGYKELKLGLNRYKAVGLGRENLVCRLQYKISLN